MRAVRSVDPLTPPRAARRPQVTRLHGHDLCDDYAWLRERHRPEVRGYLAAENAYADAVMAATAGPLQTIVHDEMLQRIAQTDATVPSRLNDYWYYSRTVEGRQHRYMCRRQDRLGAPEELLLDLNQLAERSAYLELTRFVPSDDGRLLAYAIDATGDGRSALYVKDLAASALLPVRIDHVVSVAWARDASMIFYTTADAVTRRANRCWRRAIGADRSDLIYEEGDQRFELGLSRSLDREMLFLLSASKSVRECRFLRSAAPLDEFRVIVPRDEGEEYDVSHHRGRFYLRTNRGGAANFCVLASDGIGRAAWRWSPFIDHDPDVKIEGLTFFAQHLVVSERANALAHLRIVDLHSGTSHHITVDEPCYALSLYNNYMFDTTTIRVCVESPVTPRSIFEYDLQTRERTLIKRDVVSGGYDPALYETRRSWVTVRDGARVPISMVLKKGAAASGPAPLVLHGYGAYGASVACAFDANRLSLLDRGVIYAIAHVRGGGDLGQRWREQGRLRQKLNSFHDFVDCAEQLVADGWTAPDRLAIHGGSAGGLLVAAAANLRPDLFRTVVAEVPFVDVVNSMLDASLPLTIGEYEEWGCPADHDDFEYMLAYSPYENVRPQAYPAILATAALHDSRVPFWEAAKYVARLRATQTGRHVVLLKTDLSAGHSGPAGRYDALRWRAFVTAFILQQTVPQRLIKTPTEAGLACAADRDPCH